MAVFTVFAKHEGKDKMWVMIDYCHHLHRSPLACSGCKYDVIKILRYMSTITQTLHTSKLQDMLHRYEDKCMVGRYTSHRLGIL